MSMNREFLTTMDILYTVTVITIDQEKYVIPNQESRFLMLREQRYKSIYNFKSGISNINLYLLFNCYECINLVVYCSVEELNP